MLECNSPGRRENHSYLNPRLTTLTDACSGSTHNTCAIRGSAKSVNNL